jgi:hypothetical protein
MAAPAVTTAASTVAARITSLATGASQPAATSKAEGSLGVVISGGGVVMIAVLSLLAYL